LSTRGGAPGGEGSQISSDILTALSGLDANHDRAVARRTRRVVQSSMGVLRERDQSKARARALALGVTFVVILLITPHIWEATESFTAGEHLGDPGSQLSLWACVLCPVLLASALIVGWWRRNRT